MSFESYPYDGVAFDYFAEKYPYSDQPKKLDESKSGSDIAKLTDSLIEDKLLDRIEAIEKRLLALENKRPEYVPPPMYGPTKYICPQCGERVDSDFHSCKNQSFLFSDNIEDNT